MLLSYLAIEIVRQPLVFLRRWYVEATEMYWSAVAERAAVIDRVFAIKITLRTLGQPLYGDYSIIGRIIGPLFRLSRALLALAVFAVYFGAAAVLWLFWVLAIPYLIFVVIRN